MVKINATIAKIAFGIFQFKTFLSSTKGNLFCLFLKVQSNQL